MKITKLTTKDGVTIPLRDFTVLVGPNNVGKSQTLRDINEKTVQGPSARTTIIDSVGFEKPNSFEDLLTGLKVSNDPSQVGIHLISGIKPDLLSGDTVRLNLDEFRKIFEQRQDLDYVVGNLSKFRVSYLDAASRLKVAQSAESFNPHEGGPQNLLQGLFSNPAEESKLQKAFQDTFQMDIRLDYSGMRKLCFRVAKEFGEIPGDPREAFPILGQYSRLDEQGDGFRSFVGVVLSLILSRGRIILLDEPEAFLHPAQARQLGYWIANHLRGSSGQVIIATHNASFLAGILASGQSVDIYRLNRSDSTTTYTLLSSDATSNLAKSPILSSQRVLEAVFYRGVIVCEADADRAVYQTVATRQLDTQDFLFVHAHNKQTIPKVVSLLKSAAIPVCAITDIDMLVSKDEFAKVYSSLSGREPSNELVEVQSQILAAIEGRPEDAVLADLSYDLKELVAQLERGEHNLAGARGALNRVRQGATKWNHIKRSGISVLVDDLREKANRLISQSKEIGLFIVSVGELESWLDLGTRQKNKWIVLALEALHSGTCPADLKTFLAEAIDFLSGDRQRLSEPTKQEVEES